MESSQKMLEILNDKCLYEILEQNCIDVDDLGEIGATCTHLQEIAHQIFRKKFKLIDDNNNIVMAEWPVEKLVKCLRHFGDHFTTFRLDGQNYRVPRLLANYCKNIVDLKGNFVCDLGLKMFYSKLEQLEHNRGRFDGVNQFLDNSSLRRLSLAYCEANLPEKRLSQLEYLKLFRVSLFPGNIITFSQQNDQIASLEIWFSDDLFVHAFQHLVNLKELIYMFDHSDKEPATLTGFENLTKLATLRVQMSTDSTLKVLNALRAANAPLTSLTMTYIRSNYQVIPMICQFKKIRTLHFEYDRKKYSSQEYIHSVNGQGLQQIINDLPQLADIGCESDDIQVADILEAIQNAKQLQRAYFKIEVSDYEQESANIRAISALASKRRIYVKIEFFDRLVSAPDE